MVIYYLFPALSRWNSSVIKLFVHPCIRAHINIYFNYEDIIYIVCFLSARPFARFHLKWAKRFKDGTCFVFIVSPPPPFISLNVLSEGPRRGCAWKAARLRGSASCQKRTSAWTSEARPRRNNWQGEGRGGGRRKAEKARPV